MKMLSLAFWKAFFPFVPRHSKRNRPDNEFEHPYLLLSAFNDQEIEAQIDSKARLSQKGTGNREILPFGRKIHRLLHRHSKGALCRVWDWRCRQHAKVNPVLQPCISHLQSPDSNYVSDDSLHDVYRILVKSWGSAFEGINVLDKLRRVAWLQDMHCGNNKKQERHARTRAIFGRSWNHLHNGQSVVCMRGCLFASHPLATKIWNEGCAWLCRCIQFAEKTEFKTGFE